MQTRALWGSALIPVLALAVAAPSAQAAAAATPSAAPAAGAVPAGLGPWTAPKELPGDGRPDLPARDKASGHVHLYAHDGTDGFESRVKIRSAWTGHRRVLGAGDIDGDGRHDPVSRDPANRLWLNAGTGRGTFAGRVELSAQAAYWKSWSSPACPSRRGLWGGCPGSRPLGPPAPVCILGRRHHRCDTSAPVRHL